MYWPYFEPYEDDDEAHDDVDHGQDHSRKKMCSPSPKHNNFKEEILEYPTMTKMKYKKLRCKVEQYMRKSKRIKALRAHFGHRGWEQLYGISKGAPVGEDHLFAVILYCDFTEIFTKMSETFRCLGQDETVEEVKERNKSFWWMSKKLRELIELFVDDYSRHGTPNRVKGPFFCGISFVASPSSFNINLRGHTSTTKQISISINFSGERGIIISLDNARFPGSKQKW